MTARCEKPWPDWNGRQESRFVKPDSIQNQSKCATTVALPLTGNLIGSTIEPVSAIRMTFLNGRKRRDPVGHSRTQVSHPEHLTGRLLHFPNFRSALLDTTAASMRMTEKAQALTHSPHPTQRSVTRTTRRPFLTIAWRGQTLTQEGRAQLRHTGASSVAPHLSQRPLRGAGWLRFLHARSQAPHWMHADRLRTSIRSQLCRQMLSTKAWSLSILGTAIFFLSRRKELEDLSGART